VLRLAIGTKSVLYGAHAFFLHPWFVAWAWWKLYGFPWDPRLWVAFFVHDLGYIGKPDMDGEEGEQHPALGARIMCALFDWFAERTLVPLGLPEIQKRSDGDVYTYRGYWLGPWGLFSLLHSRYLAKQLGMQPSRLCIADKLAIALTPAWLYLPMVRATGELEEYMDRAHKRAASSESLNDEERRESTSDDAARWYAGVQAYVQRWVDEHKDGKVDTWTGSQGAPSDRAAGVWK
jgi:hypothetical protein